MDGVELYKYCNQASPCERSRLYQALESSRATHYGEGRIAMQQAEVIRMRAVRQRLQQLKCAGGITMHCCDGRSIIRRHADRKLRRSRCEPPRNALRSGTVSRCSAGYSQGATQPDVLGRGAEQRIECGLAFFQTTKQNK